MSANTVAFVSVIVSATIALATIVFQFWGAKLDYTRTARRAPYGAFGVAINDLAYELRSPSPLDRAAVDPLLRQLVICRVEIDLVGSQPVRRWAFRSSLALSAAVEASERLDRVMLARYLHKLHDARAGWVQACRRELAVSNADGSDWKRDLGLDDQLWLDLPPRHEQLHPDQVGSDVLPFGI
jgi:hypothetical protein